MDPDRGPKNRRRGSNSEEPRTNAKVKICAYVGLSLRAVTGWSVVQKFWFWYQNKAKTLFWELILNSNQSLAPGLDSNPKQGNINVPKIEI